MPAKIFASYALSVLFHTCIVTFDVFVLLFFFYLSFSFCVVIPLNGARCFITGVIYSSNIYVSLIMYSLWNCAKKF